MTSRSLYRATLLAVLAVIALVASTYTYRLWQLSSDDHGFKHFTDIALPQGVSVVAHASQFDDALFHESHYWLLRGSAQSIRSLAVAFSLDRSDEDAGWALPDMQRHFGLDLQRADVVEGYEGNATGGRDHWLLMFAGNRSAVFEF